MSSKFILTILIAWWKLNDGKVKNRLKFSNLGNPHPLKVIFITLGYSI
ncbi:hypothetical protein HY229_00655 [Candidatus Acetothermia bacterium]|nr:hypothetical protein [Candidatus Acetothermia bacterium]MBI3642600.1 hypothetical protein [Candidatus Acetothermia bacterium]